MKDSNAVIVVPAGEVRVSDQALHTLIKAAIGRVSGAAPLRDAQQGIRIRPTPDGIAVELRIAVQYGAPIDAVAQNVAAEVQSTLVYALGLAVVTVHVLVQGTRR